MSTIGIDQLGSFLGVQPDLYLGGKFVSDILLPPAAAAIPPDPLIATLFGLAMLCAIFCDFGSSGAMAPPPLPSPIPPPIPLPPSGLLILTAAAILYLRGRQK